MDAAPEFYRIVPVLAPTIGQSSLEVVLVLALGVVVLITLF
jgi:hypothetical protein